LELFSQQAGKVPTTIKAPTRLGEEINPYCLSRINFLYYRAKGSKNADSSNAFKETELELEMQN
jgi:hypothetical protein